MFGENNTAKENYYPILCPNCNRQLTENGICFDCGWQGSGITESQLPPLEIGKLLTDKYEIRQVVSTNYSSINKYIAFDLDEEHNVVIKEGPAVHDSEGRISSLREDSLSRSLRQKQGIQTDFSAARPTQLLEEGFEQDIEVYRPNPRLELEYLLLEEVQYPTIINALDRFVVEDRSYLVEEYVDGWTLREAWQAEETDRIQQFDWLIQLCQALSKLHTAGILYNGIHPDLLVVSEDERLALSEFGWAMKLPLSEDYEAEDNYYTAPELILTPDMADIRADLYSLGATWLSLLLERPLKDEDFEGPFLPKLPTDIQPNLHPEINRILLQVFNRDMEQRCAKSGEIMNEGKLPSQELQEEILELKKELRIPTLIAGGRTNVGASRENNEDSYWIQVASAGNEDGQSNNGIFIVSDGVGGAMAGEIASQIAVQIISNTLSPILTENVVSDSYEDNIIPEIGNAIKTANEQVNAHAQHTLGLPVGKMGCTITVAVVIGWDVYVGHIGDSRLYLFTEGVCYQKTEDHVKKSTNMLEKAIGIKRSVEPDIFSFQIDKGDTLLLCSDGLTDYAEMETIEGVVLKNSPPQEACDTLVNLANAGGGGDNITAVIVEAGN